MTANAVVEFVDLTARDPLDHGQTERPEAHDVLPAVEAVQELWPIMDVELLDGLGRGILEVERGI